MSDATDGAGFGAGVPTGLPNDVLLGEGSTGIGGVGVGPDAGVPAADKTAAAKNVARTMASCVDSYEADLLFVPANDGAWRG